MISEMIKKKSPEVQKISEIAEPNPKLQKTDDKLAEYIGASSKKEKRSLKGFFSNFFSSSKKKDKKK